MKDLKSNNDILVTAWFNSDLICNQNWKVYSSEENGAFFILVKDPMTNNEIKFKIEKTTESL